MTGLVSWLNRDFWGPVWPNLVASAICAAAAVLRIRVHLRRHHQVQAQQHREQHEKTMRLISGLHDRLDQIGAEARGNR